VDHLNRERPLHIVTLEDPIEFIHSSQRSRISQREIGRHSHGFAQALRAALRQDPDVIMLGELRDPQTIRLALTAAETGHLVLATVHTGSAAKTIDRLVDVFAAEEKQLVRAMLAESLQAVVSQVLVERVGGGRVAAHEILLATPAVRNLVREGKVA
ncbi:twitching motility protein PilT, partial [Pseudomonas frederiksbergensis]|nr:twitching motility protein PilT [Pseudomonas frederiksbergensis]